MKNSIFCFILLLLIVGSGNSQQLTRLSVEGSYDYFHPYHSSTIKSNNLKYGYSIRFSDYINRLKVTFGAVYSPHSFVLKNSDIGSTIRSTDYNIIRIYYPSIFSYQIIDKKVSIYVSFGPVLNSLIRFNNIVHYQDGSQLVTNNLSVNKGMGISLYTDINVSLSLNNRFKLNLNPFMQFNLLQDHTSGVLGYQELLNEKPYLGLKLGLEYFIK